MDQGLGPRPLPFRRTPQSLTASAVNLGSAPLKFLKVDPAFWYSETGYATTVPGDGARDESFVIMVGEQARPISMSVATGFWVFSRYVL